MGKLGALEGSRCIKCEVKTNEPRLYYCKNLAVSRAAVKGTDQLSSTTGMSSTIAQSALMPVILLMTSANAKGRTIVPVYPNHQARRDEQVVAPKTKASEPAIDLLLLKDHLLPFPNRRPIKSANPSPAAMVDTAKIPTMLSCQNIVVAKSKTRQ